MSLRRFPLAAAFLCFCILGLQAGAQPAQRSLEELKAETQARADRNAYPLIGLKADDVREALANIKSLQGDDWAAAWSAVGDRYMEKNDFHMAWLVYSFARWPVPNSPGKQRAYEKALAAYVAYAQS